MGWRSSFILKYCFELPNFELSRMEYYPRSRIHFWISRWNFQISLVNYGIICLLSWIRQKLNIQIGWCFVLFQAALCRLSDYSKKFCPSGFEKNIVWSGGEERTSRKNINFLKELCMQGWILGPLYTFFLICSECCLLCITIRTTHASK